MKRTIKLEDIDRPKLFTQPKNEEKIIINDIDYYSIKQLRERHLISQREIEYRINDYREMITNQDNKIYIPSTHINQICKRKNTRLLYKDKHLKIAIPKIEDNRHLLTSKVTISPARVENPLALFELSRMIFDELIAPDIATTKMLFVIESNGNVDSEADKHVHLHYVTDYNYDNVEAETKKIYKLLPRVFESNQYSDWTVKYEEYQPRLNKKEDYINYMLKHQGNAKCNFVGILLK